MAGSYLHKMAAAVGKSVKNAKNFTQIHQKTTKR